jgi:choline dehydrogenase-like flavoprotein
VPTAKETVDVLIVGSGASGGPFAWHLSNFPGIKVVCLEQGDWVGNSQAGAEAAPDDRRSGAEEQRRRLTTQPPREGVQSYPNGYPYDYTESSWQPVLGNGVGGATLHYGAQWVRLHPSDFIVHSLDGVAADWPIRYWDLAPYYDFVDNFVGISGVPGDPAYPPRSVKCLPTHRLNDGAEILRRGFDKLGWHWWPADQALITMPHAGRPPCTEDGDCPREARASADVVFWPEAIRNGVVLKPKSRVREITVNSKGLAASALYYDSDGHLQEQKARLIVLACNGIGTPHLLLNSKSRYFPEGLANGSGLVGKNLMAHPLASMTALHEEGDPRKGRGTGLRSEQFHESDPRRGFARGFQFISGAYGGPIAIALGELPQSATIEVLASLRSDVIARGALAWGRHHHSEFEQQSHTISVTMEGEQLPDEANRVELHPSLTDEFSIPGVKLIFKRMEATTRLLEYSKERAKDLLEACSATKIVPADKLPPRLSWAPGHYMGTARMGTDATTSVVDRWGRAHDVKNLFIIDGSVFVTSGCASPAATIHAIAVRTADYIKTNARKLLT